MKGLMVSIIGTDCSNKGVTSGKKHAVLVYGNCKVFESSNDMPALKLIETEPEILGAGYLNVTKPNFTHNLNFKGFEVNRVRAVPVNDLGEPVAGSFGGHYIDCSDSRFPYYSPIPVFDRFE